MDKYRMRYIYTIIGACLLLFPIITFTFYEHFFTALVVSLLLIIPLNAFAFSTVYHKLFSHRAFRPKPWVPYAGTLIGVLLFLPSPKTFASQHRMHHKFSDTDKDPHTPLHGKLTTFFPYIFKNDQGFCVPPDLQKSITKDIDREYPLLSKITEKMTVSFLVAFNTILFFLNIDIFVISLLVVSFNMFLHGYANTFFHKVNKDTSITILNMPYGTKYISPEFNHATHHERASSYDFSNDGAKDWMAPIIEKYLSR